MSRCKSVSDLLGAYIYGDLSVDEMRKVRVHAGECAECASKLASMTRTVQLIPNGLPTLTDEEKHRITWAVKGAVRAKEQPKRFFLFFPAFAKGFAVLVIAVGAFAAGMALKQPDVRTVVIKEQAPIYERRETAESSPSENAVINSKPKLEISSSKGTPADWFDRARYDDPIYRHRNGNRVAMGDPESVAGGTGMTIPWDSNIGTAPSLWDMPGVVNQQDQTGGNPNDVAMDPKNMDNSSSEDPKK